MHKKMEAILSRVQKPARYVGGEWGSVMKDKKNVDLRFAFCFPDTYEVAMSHLGSRILYGLLNDQKGIWCERVCAPWIDMEAEMREAGLPLYGLESGDPLSDFDIIAFTLQYELSFSNILNMLDLGGIPVLAKDRTELKHIVACGGPCAYNPEPLADFVDLFMIGDGEEIMLEFTDLYRKAKRENWSKQEFLIAAAQIEGMYVPALYEVKYHEDGTIEMREMLDLGLTIDERLADGYYYSKTIRLLKKLTGRPIGINLEPVADDAEIETDPMWAMSAGRRATVENALRAKKLGIDFVLLTGNPGVGVTNTAIEQTLRRFKEAVGDSIVLAAGKMHAAGILSEAAENIMTEQDIASFVEAGADIILLPAPGTVPGITQEYAQRLITCAHQHGALTITSIGTSQEGADTDTIKRIALLCKMAGTDIHHLGDTGYFGMALPENIMAYSIAVRGVRHTYHRMACSVER